MTNPANSDTPEFDPLAQFNPTPENLKRAADEIAALTPEGYLDQQRYFYLLENAAPKLNELGGVADGWFYSPSGKVVHMAVKKETALDAFMDLGNLSKTLEPMGWSMVPPKPSNPAPYTYTGGRVPSATQASNASRTRTPTPEPPSAFEEDPNYTPPGMVYPEDENSPFAGLTPSSELSTPGAGEAETQQESGGSNTEVYKVASIAHGLTRTKQDCIYVRGGRYMPYGYPLYAEDVPERFAKFREWEIGKQYTAIPEGYTYAKVDLTLKKIVGFSDDPNF